MKRTDPVEVILRCEANPSTDTVEIDRAEWESMTPSQRAKMLDDLAVENVNNSGGWGWGIADPDDEAAVGTAPSTVEFPLADNRAALDADTPRSVLVDTTDGPRLVTPDAVLADDSTTTRVLLTRADLRDRAGAAGFTLAQLVRADAATIAAELNHLRTEGK